MDRFLDAVLEYLEDDDQLMWTACVLAAIVTTGIVLLVSNVPKPFFAEY